ncbi:MAG: hypothetical protein LBF75_04810 [Treponema sp.]|jgi:hypothetical protein|nr:hypothetical protein [Treponema sp.]
MYVQFYLPNAITTTTDFIIDSFSYTEIYYKDLKPADNSCHMRIPFNVDMANTLKINNNKHIKIQIKNDDNTNLFTGYIRRTFNFEKTQRNQPITIEIVSPSYFLKKKLQEEILLFNQSVSTIITTLLQQANCTDIGNFSIQKTVSFFNAKKGDDIYTTITNVLFEFGFTFDFNSDGNFVVYPLFNQPGTITQFFNGNNIREQITQSVVEEKYDRIEAAWKKGQFFTHTKVFEDTTGNNAAHPYSNIPVKPGAYYLDTEWVYLGLDSELGTVRYISNVDYLIIQSNQSINTRLVVEGQKIKVSIRNVNNVVEYITRFEVYADAYIETEPDNTTKTTNTGDSLLEVDIKYLTNDTDINSLIQNLENYYRYVDFTVDLKSYAKYPLGSFVSVTELGMGTITGRIISKKYTLIKPIEYTIEAISEFVPAPVPETEKKEREPIIITADTIKAKSVIVETIEVQGQTIMNKTPAIAGEDDPGVPPEESPDKTLLAESSGELTEISLTKGWYYVELQGGGGGKAPNYETTSGSNYYGKYGESGETILTSFFLQYDAKVILKAGSSGTGGYTIGVNGSTDPRPIRGSKGSPSYLLVPQYGVCLFVDGGREGTQYAVNKTDIGTPPLASYARIYKKNE